MIIVKGSLVMNKEEFEQKLIEQIEIYKNNAIENIKKEAMVPAMWDVTQLIDLKAQIGLLKDIQVNED